MSQTEVKINPAVDKIYDVLTSECFYQFYQKEMEAYITGEMAYEHDLTPAQARRTIKKRIAQVFKVEFEDNGSS